MSSPSLTRQTPTSSGRGTLNAGVKRRSPRPCITPPRLRSTSYETRRSRHLQSCISGRVLSPLYDRAQFTEKSPKRQTLSHVLRFEKKEGGEARRRAPYMAEPLRSSRGRPRP